MPSTDQPPAAAALMQTALGYMPAQVIHVTIRLGIADALGSGARSIAEVADRTGTRAPELRRLLRALITLGLVAEEPPDRFRLTPAGEPMRADRPDSIRPMVMMYFDDPVWRSWGRLAHTVRTGQPAFEHTTGVMIFDYLTGDPELARTLNSAMAMGSRGDLPHLLASVDFARFRSVADIGGGNGTLLAGVLSAHPSVRGVLFDTEAGVREAPAVLEAAGVADRCRVEDGDFFLKVPAGCDAYLLKSVLHDWPDDRAAAILRSCRAAMPADGTLLIVELVAPAQAAPWADPFTAISDMNLMVMTAGQERTEQDWRTLLASAGFSMVRAGDPGGATGHRIIEAAPVGSAPV